MVQQIPVNHVQEPDISMIINVSPIVLPNIMKTPQTINVPLVIHFVKNVMMVQTQIVPNVLVPIIYITNHV